MGLGIVAFDFLGPTATWAAGAQQGRRAQGLLASVEGSELLRTTASRSCVKIERFRFRA